MDGSILSGLWLEAIFITVLILAERVSFSGVRDRAHLGPTKPDTTARQGRRCPRPARGRHAGGPGRFLATVQVGVTFVVEPWHRPWVVWRPCARSSPMIGNNSVAASARARGAHCPGHRCRRHHLRHANLGGAGAKSRWPSQCRAAGTLGLRPIWNSLARAASPWSGSSPPSNRFVLRLLDERSRTARLHLRGGGEIHVEEGRNRGSSIKPSRI